MTAGERRGVRERDLSKWDTWKRYVIGTHRRHERVDPDGRELRAGDRYFYEEATWPKADGSPTITAQVQPFIGTTDDSGRFAWSVEWAFSDGAYRDHGFMDGREAAKSHCMSIVREGVAAALERRTAERGKLESARQTGFSEYVDDPDDGAAWRQSTKKPKRRAKVKSEGGVHPYPYDDVPEGF